MPVVTTRIRVDADGTISGKAPQGVPPGEYEAPIEVAAPRRAKRKRLDLPVHHEYWDDSVSLRREEFAGRQVHDANIVATMLAHGEKRLLTMNRSDFQQFVPQIEIVER